MKTWLFPGREWHVNVGGCQECAGWWGVGKGQRRIKRAVSVKRRCCRDDDLRLPVWLRALTCHLSGHRSHLVCGGRLDGCAASLAVRLRRPRTVYIIYHFPRHSRLPSGLFFLFIFPFTSALGMLTLSKACLIVINTQCESSILAMVCNFSRNKRKEKTITKYFIKLIF